MKRFSVHFNESYDEQNLDNQVNAAFGAHMKEYRNNGKQQLDNPN